MPTLANALLEGLKDHGGGIGVTAGLQCRNNYR